jgi:hypothetical protein
VLDKVLLGTERQRENREFGYGVPEPDTEWCPTILGQCSNSRDQIWGCGTQVSHWLVLDRTQLRKERQSQRREYGYGVPKPDVESCQNRLDQWDSCQENSRVQCTQVTHWLVLDGV